jgi:hypothetical protein
MDVVMLDLHFVSVAGVCRRCDETAGKRERSSIEKQLADIVTAWGCNAYFSRRWRAEMWR